MSTPNQSRAALDVETPPKSSARAGGIGALVATATFLFGIVLFITQLADFTAADATAADSVAFLVDHEAILFVGYAVIYLLFGLAIVPLVRALQQRVHRAEPELAAMSAVFGYVWVGLMFATGMVLTIGMGEVADLAGDAAQAESLFTAIDTVGNGLGGGNELVGGVWILLVSRAAQRAAALPRWLNVLGVVTALAGIVTVIPALTEVGMVFGLGCIAWFAAVGRELLRHPSSDEAATR